MTLKFPLPIRLLLWIASALVSFAVVAASMWLTRLDRLGIAHDNWIAAFVQIFVLYLIPAGLAYLGGLVALWLTPELNKQALEASTNDTWAYVVAIVTGAILGAALFSIFSNTQLRATL